MAISRRFDNVLVVSGLSGVGKSTFINRFLSGSLADDVALQLPKASPGWYLINEGICVKKRLSLDGALSTIPPTCSNLMIHYDATIVFRCGLRGYEDDPLLGICEYASTVIILVLNAPPAQILAQYYSRQRKQKFRIKKMWNNFVRKPIGKLSRRALGINFCESAADLYINEDAVRYYYSRWLDYVTELEKRHEGVRVIHIQPYSNGSELVFRLVTTYAAVTSSPKS